VKTQGASRDIVFLSGVRTPFGTFGGAFRDLSAIDLTAVTQGWPTQTLHQAFDAANGWTLSGTGPEAAGLSASVRYTLRGITQPGADTEALLERLNQVLLARGGDDQERFCTVIFGLIRPSPTGFHVRLSTGGHPEPLLQRSDGTVIPLPAGGSLLGALPEVRILTNNVELERGDRLVLYTDGVSEARKHRRFLGTEGLIDIVRRAPESAAKTTEWIESEVLDWSGGRLEDDMAVLVLHAEP